MVDCELTDDQRRALDKDLSKLVRAAERLGLSVQDLIDLLNAGMTTLQIVNYLDAQAAGHERN